jgi:hypothetical protein
MENEQRVMLLAEEVQIDDLLHIDISLAYAVLKQFTAVVKGSDKTDVILGADASRDDAAVLSDLDHGAYIALRNLRNVNKRSAYDTVDRPDKEELQKRKDTSGAAHRTVLLLELIELFLVSLLIVSVLSLKFSLLSRERLHLEHGAL